MSDHGPLTDEELAVLDADLDRGTPPSDTAARRLIADLRATRANEIEAEHDADAWKEAALTAQAEVERLRNFLVKALGDRMNQYWSAWANEVLSDDELAMLDRAGVHPQKGVGSMTWTRAESHGGESIGR